MVTRDTWPWQRDKTHIIRLDSGQTVALSTFSKQDPTTRRVEHLAAFLQNTAQQVVHVSLLFEYVVRQKHQWLQG